MNSTDLYTPWPDEFQAHYKRLGLWSGDVLSQLIRPHAFSRGHKTAVTDSERSITYRELYVTSESHAYKLWDLGLRKGDRVVLHMPNCVEFFEVLFSLLRLGVIPVMALPLQRESEITQLLEHSGARAYITKLGGAKCEYHGIANLVKRRNLAEYVICSNLSEDYCSLASLTLPMDENFKAESVAANEVAIFQLSGGTTGQAKLIPRTHDDYFYSIKKSVEICNLSDKTVYLAAMPLAHNFILSSPGTLGVLFAGGCVVIPDDPTAKTCFKLIDERQITMTALVPPLLLTWLSARNNKSSDEDLSSLKLIQVGGAKLSLSVAEKVSPTLGCKLQQVFGMAEGLVNYTRLDDPDEVILGSQGSPMSPEDEVMIVDDDDKAVAPGTAGHLLTRGPYTIRGYYGDKSQNDKAFTGDGFYRTGDIVKQLASGHMVVTGRSKDQINRGGEKISAEELENILLHNINVLDVAVISLPDEYLGECSCAVVIPKPGVDLTNKQAFKKIIFDFLRTKKIAAFKVPDRIEIIEQLPTTRFGKVDKKRLRAKYSKKVNLNKMNQLCNEEVFPV